MKVFTDDKYLITSFKRFVEIVEERHSPTTIKPYQWYFRGHSNLDYKLMPSIGRLLGTERFPTVKHVEEAEKNAFSQFEIQTYSDLREPNLFILLAIAQHHGLKTRLLDWTLSPLVALFFAVENESKTDGAFFAFNAQKKLTTILRKTESPFDDLGSSYQYLSIPSLTPRISAQSGIFQLFREPTKPFEDANYLEKFIIPESAKRDIKIDLNNFGVSYYTLFPDLDGLSKKLNYILLNEKPY
ncbi:FRG domain-containing protein [Mucilaginibacter terrae]|uniref:FRG domain-containing protein n=1 Tax=Mucilaginibacter terrae TaxID=1955052 RepID=A0ABU3GW73_9SPHI|nr:FRG domain-containing protein [Mucilaginibacter terrae]MDT3404012.1 hypothetical protein [Mucilaginibacter terrae]